MDGSVRRLSGDVEPLADTRSRFGNFFVTGNHEYYSGAPAWIGKMQSLGFTVLNNSHRIIAHNNRKILLAGVTDYNAGRFYESHRSDPRMAIRGAPDTNFKLLLAHQPKSIFASSKAGFDLQISGHTHGSQFFPWNFMVHFFQPYVAGLHHHGNTQTYQPGYRLLGAAPAAGISIGDHPSASRIRVNDLQQDNQRLDRHRVSGDSRPQLRAAPDSGFKMR